MKDKLGSEIMKEFVILRPIQIKAFKEYKQSIIKYHKSIIEVQEIVKSNSKTMNCLEASKIEKK